MAWKTNSGNLPGENGSSLQSDNASSGLLYAIAGRSAIIQRRVMSGNVAGSYLKIDAISII